MFSTLQICKHQRAHVNPGSGRSKCHAILWKNGGKYLLSVALCMVAPDILNVYRVIVPILPPPLCILLPNYF